MHVTPNFPVTATHIDLRLFPSVMLGMRWGRREQAPFVRTQRHGQWRVDRPPSGQSVQRSTHHACYSRTSTRWIVLSLTNHTAPVPTVTSNG
jgi:hypothetical protein